MEKSIEEEKKKAAKAEAEKKAKEEQLRQETEQKQQAEKAEREKQERLKVLPNGFLVWFGQDATTCIFYIRRRHLRRKSINDSLKHWIVIGPNIDLNCKTRNLNPGFSRKRCPWNDTSSNSNSTLKLSGNGWAERWSCCRHGSFLILIRLQNQHVVIRDTLLRIKSQNMDAYHVLLNQMAKDILAS